MSFFQIFKNGISKVKVAGLAGMALTLQTLASIVRVQDITFGLTDPTGQTYIGNCVDQLNGLPGCTDFLTIAQASLSNGGCNTTLSFVNTTSDATEIGSYTCTSTPSPRSGENPLANSISLFQDGNSTLNFFGNCLSKTLTTYQDICNDTNKQDLTTAIGVFLGGALILGGLYWCAVKVCSKKQNDPQLSSLLPTKKP